MAVLLAISLPSWWRETSSHSASARGTKAYEKKQYAASVWWHGRAQQIAPSSRGAFNLGTAQIAAGQREQGSATLADAIKDPALRADALFNRGNSALASKAYDHAIRDYIETLRIRPNHAGAKRNLEIALARRASSQRSTAGDRQNRKGNNQQQQQPSPAAGDKPRGQPDLETLLRSVQQQEQEELRRMKGRVQADARVGW